jgi:trehalose 6-phosphate phosphatase
MSVTEFAIADLAEPKPLQLAGAALFLDLDGTLAPIAARPQDVGYDPRLTRLLDALQAALDGRLAVISGRALADIDRILEGRVACVAAVHGLVRRAADGSLWEETPHPALPLAAERLQRFAERDSGLLVEDKALSIALHYRLAPRMAAEAAAFVGRLAEETGLTLQPGDMVEELRTPGPTKGDSVRAFMRAPPFAGARPVFLGDDHTDEPGFEAVQALGGVGVQVGARRPTVAHFRLADVDAALSWLEGAL